MSCFFEEGFWRHLAYIETALDFDHVQEVEACLKPGKKSCRGPAFAPIIYQSDFPTEHIIQFRPGIGNFHYLQ